jgi:hypothetical protein
LGVDAGLAFPFSGTALNLASPLDFGFEVTTVAIKEGIIFRNYRRNSNGSIFDPKVVADVVEEMRGFMKRPCLDGPAPAYPRPWSIHRRAPSQSNVYGVDT